MLWNLLASFLVSFSKYQNECNVYLVLTAGFLSRKSWDCETCIADVQAMADVGMSNDASMAIQDTLQGPAFCEAEDLGLTEDQVATCKTYTEGIGNAFGFIFFKIGEHAADVCRDLYQICEA